jgi:hypothetical protein
MVLFELARFCCLALTDAAMLPALQVMRKNQRHFELFLGIFQLAISFLFNVAEAFHVSLFLKELQWHFISDVLSVAYFLVLCVHLMGFRDENTNIVLRYIAFAFAWLMKSKDGWDTTTYEVLLVVSYIVGVVYRRVLSSDSRIAPLQKNNAKLALGFLLLAAVVGAVPIYFSSDSDWSIGFLKGCMHVLGGAAFYYAWLSVPCLDSKKTDLIPTYI